MPPGQPTKYKPEYCQTLIELMSQGYSYASVAAELNTCRDTLHEWSRIHPEFSDAKKEGNDKRIQWWEKHARLKMIGESKGSDAICIFMLKNAAPDLYNDRQNAQKEPTDDASKILNNCSPETLSAIGRDIQSSKSNT